MTHLALPSPDADNGGSPFDALRRFDERGEYWLARELMTPLGYRQWRDFANAIERAIAALATNGEQPDKHIEFLRTPAKTSGGRPGTDYRLTRNGAYAVVQGGDPRKPEVAAGWAYFRIQTRRAETAEPVAVEKVDYGALDIKDPHAVIALAQAAAYHATRAIEQEKRADRAEGALATAAPKAEAWDVLAAADGDLAVADAAKILSRDPAINTGRDRLFDYLASIRWVYRQQGDRRWRVYQRAVEAGWLSELPVSHEHPRTGKTVVDPPQVRITIKGLQELHKRLGGSRPLAIQMRVEVQP